MTRKYDTKNAEIPDGVCGKAGPGEEAAQCISVRLRRISSRFMITVCIWVGQSVFRPAGRNPGLSFAPASLPSASRIGLESSRPSTVRGVSGWKLEIDQRRLESPIARIPKFKSIVAARIFRLNCSHCYLPVFLFVCAVVPDENKNQRVSWM